MLPGAFTYARGASRERDRIKGRSPRQAGSSAFRGADATYKNVAMIRTRTKTRAIARWDMRDISRY